MLVVLRMLSYNFFFRIEDFSQVRVPSAGSNGLGWYDKTFVEWLPRLVV